VPNLSTLKTRFRNSPIRRKLMLIVLVTIISVMGLAIVIFYVDDVLSFRHREVEHRQSLAKIVGRNTLAAIDFNDREAARETLGGLAEDHHIQSAWVVLASGEVFASYVRHPGKEDLPTVSRGGKLVIASGALTEESGAIHILSRIKTVCPVIQDGEMISTVVIISDTGELQSRMLGYLVLILLVSCGTSILGYFITLRLQRIITDPLTELVQTMERVRSTRDYSHRVAYRGRDEIGTLTGCFNQMLQEVQAHDDQLLRYQDKLSELIAIRTEELLKVKEQAEAAAVAKMTDAAVVQPPPASIIAGQPDGGQPCDERRRLFALMDCVDEEVWFIDAGGGRVLANRTAAESLGIDLAAYLDTDAFHDGCEIYRIDVKVLLGADFTPFFDLQGATVRRMEVMLLRNNSTQRYQMINSGPVRNGAGELAGTVYVVRDITLQKEAEDSLRFSARQLLESEELLRKELSAELHDEVGRDLTALHLNYEIINARLPDPVRKELQDRLGVVHGLLEDLSHKIANMVSELRPPLLDDFGLKTALQWLAGIVAVRHGIEVELLVDDGFPRLAADKETAIFRIAQEAVNNAVKHSGAKTITVSLDLEDGQIQLQVSDDGTGFDPAGRHGTEKRRSWGLTIMRERAESVGGRFSLESTPRAGTTILVEVGRD
jgi:signal transduction histidine kinase